LARGELAAARRWAAEAVSATVGWHQMVALTVLILEEEGRTPNARRIAQLLEERAGAERQGSAGTRLT
jgi:hypothetical protein